MWYEKLGEGKVQCNLCPHQCVIQPEKKGICQVRKNIDGTLYSLVYGKVISWAVDPVEKKPLYHFYPGTTAFSLATCGCNLSCRNCQNYTISQLPREMEHIPGEKFSPEKLVEVAEAKGAASIAYTYTEPTIFYEYALDTCRLAHLRGIKNIFVTNGYIMPDPLREVALFLDGANVDLKSFRDEFYRRVCGGRLKPVLESIKLMREKGIWVEVTTLIIPGMNDSQEELEQIAGFLLEIGDNIPWHLSRFYPAYKMENLPPTPIEILHRTREMALKKGLKYVYVGNVPGDEGENTFCPNCGRIVIKRRGYFIAEINIKEGKCIFCGNLIEGVGL